MRVTLLGATGTAGRAAAASLLAAGNEGATVIRPGADPLPGTETHRAEATMPEPFSAAIIASRPEAIVSCLASRTGAPAEAAEIDHRAHSTALAAALEAGASHFVLLSALCVQKPKLPFQHAKLAFEAELQAAPLTWSIVRPTAFFKSLSGQVSRVADGKPFLVFGRGDLTAAKPISDRDLGAFLASCLTDPRRQGKILPIGGPGPAITPLDQVRILEELLGRTVPIRRVPVAVMDAVIAGLSLAGSVSPSLRAKADFARIGRYYGTESMLALNPETGRYDADTTPEFGTDTLKDHYRALLAGDTTAGLGAHAVF
ncbi:MAG: NAD(P)H-binding protein [Pseudomonadota bacterium]